ncbi:hypothetical protein TELCIR_02080 [Teladorsagia circumcincta]|uniref:Uncharacterized protein n=1 Tax=Teladorsagia circumcincta TaxID=45464 RepID=A0A2G9V062_TELCI|nr:hypothetical protein TELCIR_02080 [Teladorsagia circumcincta]
MITKALFSPFPSPNKPMLYCTDSPPTEMAPPYLRPGNMSTALVSPPPPSIQLPAIACTPVRPAPKRPVQLTLDSPIPVPQDTIAASDYVPMNPPKATMIPRKESVFRLPSISPNRPKVRDPIPLINAGNPVHNRAESPTTTTAAQAKPSQNFIAALEETLKTQAQDRKARFSPDSKILTSPKPPVPSRSEKPALRITNDSPMERIYDLPAVDL